MLKSKVKSKDRVKKGGWRRENCTYHSISKKRKTHKNNFLSWLVRQKCLQKYVQKFGKPKGGCAYVQKKKLWTKSSLRKKLFHFTIIPIRWRKFGLGVEDIGEIHGWAQATVHRCANSRIRILQMQMQKDFISNLKD